MIEIWNFAKDILYPAFGRTMFGIVVIAAFVILGFLVLILSRMKEYKKIKENVREFKNDLVLRFKGKNNRKKRRIIYIVIISIIILAFSFSVIYENIQKAKQIVILKPKAKITQNLSDELELSWTVIPGTAKYHVSFYPLDIEPTYISTYRFYVEGDYTEISVVPSQHLYGGGKYRISVSSDVEGSEPGSTIVYLTMNSD